MHILECTKVNGELCGCAFQFFYTLAHFTSFLDSSRRSLILDKVCQLALQVVFILLVKKVPQRFGGLVPNGFVSHDEMSRPSLMSNYHLFFVPAAQ